ncbi:MAG: hypothetical protein P8129_12550 [Anaerolineae bacterium]
MSVGSEFVSGIATLLVAACLVAGMGAATLAQRRAEGAWPGALRWATLPLLAALFGLSDALLLRALPWLRISFGPVAGLSLLLSLLVRLGLLLMAIVVLLLYRVARRGRTRLAGLLTVFVAVNLGFSLLQVYAYAAEPLWIETTELTVTSGDLDAMAPPLHVVQLTDLHLERCHLVAQLRAPYGIYAVRGSVEFRPEWMASLIEGTDITWLEQESRTIEIRGQRLTLVGVACSHEMAIDTARLSAAMEAVPAQGFTLLLFHSPDLILDAAEQGVDLYLAGHTHGGQVILPFYGPVITFSHTGREYAAGRFQVGDTTMYVSRGLGFGGGDLPRVRFLARPEIVSLSLEGE